MSSLSLPLSVMVRSCHACVDFVLGLPSRRRCALAVALHRRDSGLGLSHGRNYPRMFSLHELFKCAHLIKFTVGLYGRIQTYVHTTSANAVTLVWGSLSLVPRPLSEKSRRGLVTRPYSALSQRNSISHATTR